MTTMRARLTSAVLALALLGGMAPGQVAAAVLWTLTASPLTATTGVSTTFSLTATNADPLALLDSSAEIGCILLDVPSNFAVESTAVTASNTGSSWVASLSGNRVKVRTTSGGDRLSTLDWVKFNVKAMPMSTGSLAWNANAYRDQGCGGTGSLLGVPPVVLVTGAVTPAPTASPTPSLTPSPSASPTPKPSRAPKTSTPKPSVTPTPTPKPTAEPTVVPTAAPTSAPAPAAPVTPPPQTPSPSSSPSPSPTPSPEETEALPTSTTPPDAGAGQQIGPPPPAAEPVQLTLGPLSLLGSIDVWAIPGVIVGVPGLLVIFFIGLQAVGALAWLPAIRRLRGKEPEALPG